MSKLNSASFDIRFGFAFRDYTGGNGYLNEIDGEMS